MGMFNAFFIVFFIMFILTSFAAGAVFVFAILYFVKERQKNDSSPRLTVDARVVDKRTVSHRHHNHNTHFSHRHYYHYVAFELSDGQRTEMRVQKIDFDSLHVGDEGQLTLQGSRFISFERKREEVLH